MMIRPLSLAIPQSLDVNENNFSILAILIFFPNLTSEKTQVDMKIHHFEHAFEVDGPLTAFYSRCLNPQKKKHEN